VFLSPYPHQERKPKGIKGALQEEDQTKGKSRCSTGGRSLCI